ncbi:Dihydrolipoyllysine-residue succinyltransferase component of 2-oxoglutarate dehydrogenase complex [Paraliobacillus sp. PM-2]|uniref:dihydrolipoamide acetyltransferase family protein n=1 Tax=Paraliobacillus sp. PM-2 TaxID=1462524 RepID=UPI00061C6097|nr:dihydrolipoamide acetyltransferase family protein [Paraliobacillus sp. PM-2]CQR46769.1 Dihydrolipoyllysine-residue succinyltransferase component of 2-oxoglutarate dehydrogenase complex [Paraliobacillus sp. PM-2]
MGLEKITMPQLGESVTEGTISNWLIQPGDHVSKYDPIAEVLTDKVNAEVPSSFTGTIKELIAQEDETIAVGDVMCLIETETNEKTSESNVSKAKTETEINQSHETNQTDMKKRYSPAVLRLAQENSIDLSEVKGNGRAGRITRKDIEKVIADRSNQVESAPMPVDKENNRSNKSSDNIYTQAGDKEIPVTGIRKAIANNMVRSTTEIPHAWMMIEVDVTNLVNYRNAEKDAFKETEGYNLSYFAFFLNAIAKALKKFPELNSSWAGDKIVQHKDINLSIAVAHGKELFVPVIKNVDEKSIKGIAKEIDQLSKKARNGSLTQEDMKGGTFTVNNTGSFGSVQSMGVINYPQAAILQVESIVKRPVIIDDMFAARDMVNLCLSLDHRVLDGVISGQFMSHIKGILENISGDTTPIY